jgi:hypothetical protein
METVESEIQTGPGKRFFIVDEELLRQKIIELSPQIHRDTGRIEDIIRELVGLEREKRGLDNPRGCLELSPNAKKTDHDHPDLIGNGLVAGRFYRAAGWLTKNGKLKIALLPKKPSR